MKSDIRRLVMLTCFYSTGEEVRRAELYLSHEQRVSKG